MCEDPIVIKFRMAHKSEQFTFSKQDKMETVFRYVNYCMRDGFENRHSEFDLTQAFPAQSFKDKKDSTLSDLFEESSGEMLIVK